MTTNSSRGRSWALVAGTALLLSFALPGSVAAHAELEATSPEQGEEVPGSPITIWADFSIALEEDSSLELRDEDGDSLATGGLDPDDPKRLLIADVPILPIGDYEVRWIAKTDDGHTENDDWTFTVVAPAEPTPTPTPTATATPTPAASPTGAASPTTTSSPSPSAGPSTAPSPSAAPSASNGPDATPSPSPAPASSVTETLLPIVAAFAIVGVIAAVLLSRRRSTPPPA